MKYRAGLSGEGDAAVAEEAAAAGAEVALVVFGVVGIGEEAEGIDEAASGWPVAAAAGRAVGSALPPPPLLLLVLGTLSSAFNKLAATSASGESFFFAALGEALSALLPPSLSTPICPRKVLCSSPSSSLSGEALLLSSICSARVVGMVDVRFASGCGRGDASSSAAAGTGEPALAPAGWSIAAACGAAAAVDVVVAAVEDCASAAAACSGLFLPSALLPALRSLLAPAWAALTAAAVGLGAGGGGAGFLAKAGTLDAGADTGADDVDADAEAEAEGDVAADVEDPWPSSSSSMASSASSAACAPLSTLSVLLLREARLVVALSSGSSGSSGSSVLWRETG